MLGELPFDGRKASFTGSIAPAMAIRMDHYIHEIGIVERRGGAIESFITEMPGRRPSLPQ